MLLQPQIHFLMFLTIFSISPLLCSIVPFFDRVLLIFDVGRLSLHHFGLTFLPEIFDSTQLCTLLHTKMLTLLLMNQFLTTLSVWFSSLFCWMIQFSESFFWSLMFFFMFLIYSFIFIVLYFYKVAIF